MSDIEKTISGLKEIADYFHECRGNASFGSKAEEHFWELQRAASDAAEMLKRQEPKPVNVTKNTYGYEFYDCPNCGRSFDLTYYKKPAYCDKCGQAVKWNDDINMP